MLVFSAKNRRALWFAFKSARSHLGRTGLSLLGVVIGVLSVVVVMALGDGVKDFVSGQVDTFGADVIQIEVKVPSTGKYSTANAGSQAQGVRITTLTLDDEEAIEKLPNIEAAYGGSLGAARATLGSTGKQVLLFGTGPDAPKVDLNLRLEQGRFFTREEDEGQARVVVLGSETKETFFGDREAIGESITLKGEKYRVVGILASRGTAGFFNLDAVTYVPIQTLQKKILGVDYLQFVSARMADADQETRTVLDLESLMRREHDIDDPAKDDFSVTSTREAKETINTVLGGLTILLIALTSISLVVGGVGIMNVMYVSVTERTSEIGLRKALGATSSDILRQFLAEALLVTLAGGILGILLGVGLSFVATLIIGHFGYPFTLPLSPASLLVGALFSIVVGVAFGLAPAARAARLSPMEALRRE
ncbi:MAG: ABC transporter permease [Candidatus Moraniibacteriota bacterium]